MVQKNVVELTSKFQDILLIDEYGKTTLKPNKFSSQKLNFKVSAKCSITKSPNDFEQLLINKIKKKIKQHQELKNEKLIIAVELEKFNGLNSFPITSVEGFSKLKEKITKDISIIIVYKDSQGDKLNIKMQAMHQNDKFINYLS